MREISALARLAFASVHELSDGLIALEQQPRLRQRRHFFTRVSNAGTAALAHLAAANESMSGIYSSKLDALRSMSGARQSLNDVVGGLRQAETRGYLAKTETAALIEKAVDCIALVMALNVAVRGRARAGV